MLKKHFKRIESKPFKLLGNERGMVLILAVGLLAIMSLLGATLMSLSMSEIKLSSNFRDSQEAFSVAERAIEYAVTGAAIRTDTEVSLYADDDEGGTPFLDYIRLGDGGSLDPAGNNQVVYIGAGTPPIGTGSDASKFQALSYVINATGVFPENSANPSRSVNRAHVAKVVPK